LHGKKASNLAYKEIEKSFTADKRHFDSELLDVKMHLKVLTPEEKIQEAGKPLYLKRYE
jgi:hypothetical protein